MRPDRIASRKRPEQCTSGAIPAGSDLAQRKLEEIDIGPAAGAIRGPKQLDGSRDAGIEEEDDAKDDKVQ